MPDLQSDETTLFLSDVPAGAGERRLACVAVVVSTVLFLLLVPFAKTPLPALPIFIPIYQAALIINDLITVVFLLGLARYARTKALSLLAGGYLFTALMACMHALSFPNLFAPAGLLDAGPQTTAWLYFFWHTGFPLFVIGYARSGANEQPGDAGRHAVLRSVRLVLAAVSGLTLLATLGHALLPPLMRGDHYGPALILVASALWIVNLAALIIVSRRRPYSVLDLWLMVVLCAWLFDIALSVVFNAGRFDLGFYAGRIYGLVAASVVLVVLLYENNKLYLKLIRLRESDRRKTAELELLSTVDPLTGIPNRRVFDETLSQEWRRMMRHHTPLSLLMIDVDYFKRFNDSYGHVGGDGCLRAIAQAVAGRARRAGELAARYGGEEFAVLLPQTGLEDATKLAELICQSARDLKIPHKGSEVSPHVSISVGVGSIEQVPRAVAALSRNSAVPAALPAGATILIETADRALYQAKTAGRDRVAAAVVCGDAAVVDSEEIAAPQASAA